MAWRWLGLPIRQKEKNDEAAEVPTLRDGRMESSLRTQAEGGATVGRDEARAGRDEDEARARHVQKIAQLIWEPIIVCDLRFTPQGPCGLGDGCTCWPQLIARAEKIVDAIT